MVIEQKNMKKTQTMLLGLLAGLWVLVMLGVWSSGAKDAFDLVFVLASTLLVLAVVLFLLLRSWGGEVQKLTAKIEKLDNPNGVDRLVDVEFATIRLPSGRLKKVRLGSDKELIRRLDIKTGDRLLKRRGELFCVVVGRD